MSLHKEHISIHKQYTVDEQNSVTA